MKKRSCVEISIIISGLWVGAGEKLAKILISKLLAGFQVLMCMNSLASCLMQVLIQQVSQEFDSAFPSAVRLVSGCSLSSEARSIGKIISSLLLHPSVSSFCPNVADPLAVVL